MHSLRGSEGYLDVTNILALPLAQVSMMTGTNEDMVESVLFQVGGTGSPSLGVPPNQLDLRGIDFAMYVRRSIDDHEVLLTLSSDDRTLVVGAFPNIGFLLFYLPVAQMKFQQPGNYVADVVASADSYVRRTLLINLSIVEGVTR
jgi:hypothetical protein